MIQFIYFVAIIIAIFQFGLMIKLWIMCDDIKSIKNKLIPEEKKEITKQDVIEDNNSKEEISDEKIMIGLGIIFVIVLVIAFICKFA